MTKQEIRAVSLAKLGLAPHHRALDIGAGTGSMTVELALRCREVVAVEKDPEALALLRENLNRFGLQNVQVVEGQAPQVLEGLGHFESVFLGGSGSELEAILNVLPNICHGKVVANAICLETLATLAERFRTAPYHGADLCEVQIARAVPAGSKTRMAALSPVWILAAQLPARVAVGKVWGVGVGPGCPDLLTLKAVRALAGAGAVMCPRSSDDAHSLALQIARSHVPADVLVEECTFPMSEQRAVTEAAWRRAADHLAAWAREGRNAVFLTLGDSTLYSTWGYVQRELMHHHPDVAWETVPGVTSLSACAARAGVPLAEGRAPLVVWPGRIPAAMPIPHAHIAIMKAGRFLRDLGTTLESWGCDAVAITNCGHANERVTRNLAESDEQGYFTTILASQEKTK